VGGSVCGKGILRVILEFFHHGLGQGVVKGDCEHSGWEGEFKFRYEVKS
jgi:hypothetical protein